MKLYKKYLVTRPENPGGHSKKCSDGAAAGQRRPKDNPVGHNPPLPLVLVDTALT